MTKDRGLQELIQQIVEVAYPELIGREIISRWGGTSCFATVSWTSDKMNISITCNTQTKNWHEAARIGLLSHELSHVVQSKSKSDENNTDIDVIHRGLGPYLAVERAISGKYEDYIISRGKDRYLGYRSIRSYLMTEELIQLDSLLQEMRLIPHKSESLHLPLHDLTLLKTGRKTQISIDGHIFTLDSKIDEAQIEIITREGVSCVYLEGREIGKYDMNEN